jgi:hypothetical protein
VLNPAVGVSALRQYATSMRKARDLAKQYMVDLYVRPPSSDGPWHNDYHQMDVIVSLAVLFLMMFIVSPTQLA